MIGGVSLPKYGEKMRENSRKSGIALVVSLVGLPMAGRADAQALPSIDRGLTLRSADNDPDLIVAREAYESRTRSQSLYLRVNDGTADRQAFSGQLIVRGAEISAIIGRGAELADSDATWGIPGVNYGGNAADRGLDGPDPGAYVPVPADPLEAVRVEDVHTVRFYFGTGADIDDMRVIIRYPAEPGPASFDIQLFNAERPDPMNWPLTQQGGIQVGSLVDAIPDDGDYSEVFEVRNIKLRIEDLDVVEDAVTIGAVAVSGGVAGPASITVDNYANDSDLDQDNGFDQNGLISPIPAGSDLEHLVFRPGPLINDRAGRQIPADAVRLDNPPRSIAVGESLPISLSVFVPADLPPGEYVGRMEVFEDNSGDRIRNGTEPFDQVSLTVFVGEIPDGGPDVGPPPDLGRVDTGPAPDGGPTDARSVDTGATDRGPSTDALSDARIDTDADGLPTEAGPSDGGGVGDGRVPGNDAGTGDAQFDARADGPLLLDATVLKPDARGDHDFGTPRGGAFSCRTTPPAHAWPWMLTLGALLPWARRRR